MLLIQIAATALIVHIIANNRVRSALNPITMAQRASRGIKPEIPACSILVASGSYWTALITGLAGVWAL